MDSNKQKRSTKAKVLITLGVVAAAALVAGGVYFLVMSLPPSAETIANVQQNGIFIDGITVQGVDVSGLNMAQAEQKMANAENEIKAKLSLPLQLEDQSYTFTADKDFKVSFNTKEVLGEAIQKGNLPGFSQNGEIDTGKKIGYQFNIDYTIDTSTIADSVAKLAAQTDKTAVDASFTLIKGADGKVPYVTTNPDSNDTSTEQQDTPAPSASPSPSPSPTASTIPGTIILPEMAQRFDYTPGQKGITIDQAKLQQMVSDQLSKKDFTAITIPAQFTEQAMTLDAVKKLTSRISVFRTSFQKAPSNRPSRVHNISKAAGIINGTELKPGKKFDINKLLGPRSLAGGWQMAPGIDTGVYRDQPGGGVCQVSTTTFNAVLLANMDYKKMTRKHHSWPSAYVEPGLDATISTGEPNFCFVNTSDSTIWVFESVDENAKTITVEIYGKAFEEGTTIVVDAVKVRTIRSNIPTTYMFEPNMTPGKTEVMRHATPMRDTKTIRYTYKNGLLINTELLYQDHYSMYGEVIGYGPGYMPPVDPNTPPAPTPTPAT